MTAIEDQERLEERLLRPLIHTSRAWIAWMSVLVVLGAAGLVAYGTQLRSGLGVTGRPTRSCGDTLALGWRGLPAQRKRLRLGGNIMMVIIIPIAIATHSVVSSIFGLTFRSGWDSTIFAPYFVVGALYSGTAMLITLMYIFRRLYRLEEHLTIRHFRLLATLLVISGLTYLYFTFAEYLTVGYKLETADSALLRELFFGRYAGLVFGFIGGQLLPVALAALPQTRTLEILFVASILANVGMWIERLVIVVPSLSEPLLPYGWGVYTPTLVEMLITLGSFAGFALMITVFAKFFPIISIDEMTEGWKHVSEANQGPVVAAPGALTSQPAGGQL